MIGDSHHRVSISCCVIGDFEGLDAFLVVAKTRTMNLVRAPPLQILLGVEAMRSTFINCNPYLFSWVAN